MPRLPRSLPIRGIQRVTRSNRRVERGATSLRAAYVRVGQAVGLDARDVAECYRLRKRHMTPPVFTPKHLLAMDMLDESESKLEERVRRLVAEANAIHPQVGERPRFAYQHHWISIHSGSGFPDDILIDRKRSRLYVWENKREIEDARPDQQAVLGVIRPSNFDALYDVLDVRRLMRHDSADTLRP